MLFWTQVVILGLVAMLHIAKITGFERLLEKLLKPVLRVIGIRENALPMSLIGMTLGLAYGGGLLIREAEKGTLAPRDIFASFALLGLCHSLIEDTLLISLTGAELSGILWARLAWALLLIAIITRILPRIPDAWLQRHLVR
jgi:spore maturation protein SpmB